MNIQNIPRADKLVKAAFIPKQDLLVSFDYSQIEYRMLAYYLVRRFDDWSMAEVFKSGRDVHAETGRLLYNLGLDDPVPDSQRQRGKTANFSVIFGGGVPTIMSQQARAGEPVTEEEAQDILDRIRAGMPGATALGDDVTAVARERGYITSLFGRRLTLDPTVPRWKAARKMLNALLQGSAADLMRHAMVQCHEWATAEELRSHMVCQVHDDLLWDVIHEELELVATTVPTLMSYDPVNEIVPIEVDCQVSPESWAEKVDYERYLEAAC